jgi:hypothetical protein
VRQQQRAADRELAHVPVRTCPKEQYFMNVITDALACIAHFLGWLV